MTLSNLKANYLNQSRKLIKTLYSETTTKKSTIYEAKKHLFNCINNPTIGMIAENQAKNTYKNKRLKSNYINNLYNLKCDNYINSINKTLDNKIKNMYPKTLEARQYFIDNNQIVLNKVKPKSNSKIKDKTSIIFRKLMNFILDEL